MRVRAMTSAVLLVAAALLAGCGAAGDLGGDNLTYAQGSDVDAFVTIPAGGESGSLVVEVPANTGVYLTGQYLLVQGKGQVNFSYGDFTGGLSRGSISGDTTAAFYTNENPGTFTIVGARGNGGDRSEPLVVEFLVYACDSMVANGGTCQP